LSLTVRSGAISSIPSNEQPISPNSPSEETSDPIPDPPISVDEGNLAIDPVKIYQSLSGIRPNKPQRAQIKSQVQDFPLWQESVEHWLSHGWNPKNIAGILDHYQRGGPGKCLYYNRSSTPDSRSLSTLDQMRAEIKESKNGDSG
jgi:hypothetical protein